MTQFPTDSSRWCIAAYALAGLFMAGCSDGSPATEELPEQGVEVSPTQVTIRVTETADLRAFRRTADGQLTNVPLVNWSVTDASVARVAGLSFDRARVFGRSGGATWVTATDGSSVDSVLVQVEPVFGGLWRGRLRIDGDSTVAGEVSVRLRESDRFTSGGGTVVTDAGRSLNIRVSVALDSRDRVGIELRFVDFDIVYVFWTSVPDNNEIAVASADPSNDAYLARLRLTRVSD